MNPPQRPKRFTLADFAGRPLTVPAEPDAWECLNPSNQSPDILLLGIGPENSATLPFIQEAEDCGGHVFWLESPELLAAYEKAPCFRQPPQEWTRIEARDVAKFSQNCRVFFHKVALRLAPEFWLLLEGEARLAVMKRLPGHSTGLKVWLPGNDKLLLWPELNAASAEMGIQVDAHEVKAGEDPSLVWQRGLPDFILSINFRGLDADGRIFSMARAMEIPVAIWLVDNPWHLLSAIRLPWWQKAEIFITDPTFIDGLQKYGAENVTFLPLACAQHMWRPIDNRAGEPPLFVGRSSFPSKERFFSGLKIPQNLEAEAKKLLLSENARPDFHWWQKKLQTRLWPGKEGRLPGYCADACSTLNRANWLRQTPARMRIIGDSGWQALLPDRSIQAPTDYYGSLPELYQTSMATLNVTSWLLPGSLNQRHFDVWAAGGLLLGDDIPGLDIFPEELTDAIRMKNPQDFVNRLAFYKDRPDKAMDLRIAWREELQKAHLYKHRLEKIMNRMKIVRP